MSIFHSFFGFDIQLFGEGTGGGDGGTGAGNTGAVSAEVAPQQTKGVKASEIVYGKEEEAPAAEEPAKETVPSEDRVTKYNQFKEEYKDLIDKDTNSRIQDAVQKRLKNTAATAEKFNQVSPMLAIMAERYGIDQNDIQGLTRAMEEDTALYEAEAAEKGVDVHQLMDIRKMQRENATLNAQLQELRNKEEGDRILAGWMQEGETLKQTYPSFDFQSEMQNPTFRNLLQSNIPMKVAFEVIHQDELIPAAMQYTAQQTKQMIANSIMANKARPAEGGMNSQNAVTRKSDVSQLTKEDRAAAIEQARRGKRIVF